MKRITLTISTLLFLAVSKPACAYVAEESAQIKINEEPKEDTRKLVLKTFLEKNKSPLASYTDKLIEESDKNNLDWRLIPAITGVESNFGRRIPYNSHNAYGWANGTFKFKSWEESIEIVSSTLKNRYIEKGARKISHIAKIYAPPSPSWANKVKNLINKIDPSGLSFALD